MNYTVVQILLLILVDILLPLSNAMTEGPVEKKRSVTAGRAQQSGGGRWSLDD